MAGTWTVHLQTDEDWEDGILTLAVDTPTACSFVLGPKTFCHISYAECLDEYRCFESTDIKQAIRAMCSGIPKKDIVYGTFVNAHIGAHGIRFEYWDTRVDAKGYMNLYFMSCIETPVVVDTQEQLHARYEALLTQVREHNDLFPMMSHTPSDDLYKDYIKLCVATWKAFEAGDGSGSGWRLPNIIDFLPYCFFDRYPEELFNDWTRTLAGVEAEIRKREQARRSADRAWTFT